MQRCLLRCVRLPGVTRQATMAPLRPMATTTGGQESSGDNNNKWIGGGVAALTVGGIAFSMTRGDNKKEEAKATDDKKAEDKPKASPPVAQTKVTPPVTTVNKDATPNLPSKVGYLLVGAGTASFAACRSIKARDPKAKVLMVSAEPRLPYMRPPLSKEMWFTTVTSEGQNDVKFEQWSGKKRSIFFEPSPFYIPYEELENRENGGISVVQGRKVVKIDAEKQVATLDNGCEIAYEKCLVATGGHPKTLDVFDRSALIRSKTTLFRTVDDFYKLDNLAKNSKKIAIIGGGFLGSELAVALGNKMKGRDLEIIQMYKEAGNMGKILPEYLSNWTTNKVRAEGVTIMGDTRIKACSVENNGKLVLHTEKGERVEVDHAVIALGLKANTDLAKTSMLEVDETVGGFRANAELEARSNLWVAGDAVSFYDVSLGRRRVEHHDHAVVSGRLAGENMTGAKKPYLHQSMFWSDLGPDIGYEAIGIIDSSLRTVGVFAKATAGDTPKEATSGDAMRSDEKSSSVDVVSAEGSNEAAAAAALTGQLDKDEKYGKGVLFYLKDDVVVGVLMWNVFNRMPLARKVVREHKKFDDLADLAKLFNIHSELNQPEK